MTCCAKLKFTLNKQGILSKLVYKRHPELLSAGRTGAGPLLRGKDSKTNSKRRFQSHFYLLFYSFLTFHSTVYYNI